MSYLVLARKYRPGTFEEVSGQDLDWFFTQWLYRTTYPVFLDEWTNDLQQDGTNEFRLRLRQIQVDDLFLGSEPYRVPVEFKIVGADLDTTVTVLSDQLDQEFVFYLPSEVTKIYLDPERWLLHEMGDDSLSPTPDISKAPVRLQAAYPNPFNPRTIFRWEADMPTHDLIEIFDVQGRRIRVQELDSSNPGPREFLWNGLDANRAAVPSGTYLYRVTCRSQASNQVWQLKGKVTLAR